MVSTAAASSATVLRRATAQRATRGMLVDDRPYSERLASIARVVDVLGEQFATDRIDGSSRDGVDGPGRSRVPSQALVDELVELVVRLQRDLTGGRPRPSLGDPAGRFRLDRSLARELTPANALTGSWAGDVTGVVTSLAAAGHEPDGVHGVHFSRSHEHAVAAVVDMVCEALDNGRAVVVVATGVHGRWIESELLLRGAELDGAEFHLLDAATTLSSLLVDGKPDHERFRSVVGTFLADVSARAPGGVSVYGEMVGLLWARADGASALRLEEFWNELQRHLPFSLMCGYLVDCATTSGHLDPIRRLHSHVT